METSVDVDDYVQISGPGGESATSFIWGIVPMRKDLYSPDVLVTVPPGVSRPRF